MNNKYLPAAALVLLFVALGVHEARADTRLTMGGGVYHMDSDRDELNEANYFVGLSHGPVFGATFVNSQGDRSAAFGAVVRSGDAMELSAYIGGVSGYNNPDWLPCMSAVDLCLFAAPSVSVWIKNDVALTGILFGDAFLHGVSVSW